MKQAQVTAWGEPPKYVDVADLGSPKPGEVQLRVLACSIHQLVRGRATGTHYSAHTLPHIPGTDGVGQTSDGKLVYFSAMSETGGSMTEMINVAVERTVPVPDGADPVQVAGLVNPVMASWLGLSVRTSGLEAGFTVVVLGATGVSGAASVGVARALGAGKVIGAARSAAKLAGLGLDGAIELANDPSQTDWSTASDADVILDFLYGPGTLSLLAALKPTKPVQYVQIGTMAKSTMDLPGDLLRSKNITLRGTGPGAWQMKDFAREAPDMIKAIASGKIQPGKFQEVKMADIETAWNQKGGDRIIITP
ncbi:GroES-like protein [Cryphonectria parasitica EP155]|uniref:GroES-like protein n=1 Tax=Cryphonectria parasitica (strain ATCC 38755 / EP155) TaxID=660469 RepID=A0A9P4Y699_CRYP1|nr:GroES-like protein [Cryphonectria parasitica EP155]KAF3767707.1 GroES-like protein [Cryphonectria parasitica EP155]